MIIIVKTKESIKKVINYMIFILIFITLILIVNFILNRLLFITRYNLKSSKIPNSFDNFKIIHLSDIHSIRSIKEKNKIISKVKRENPNIIVITGDLVDSGHFIQDVSEYIKSKDKKIEVYTLRFIKELKNIAPVYYTYGNHERTIIEYGREKSYRLELQKSGIKLLNNESDYISIDNEKIKIIGIQDPTILIAEKDFEENDSTNMNIAKRSLNENINKDENVYSILLIHRPEYFDMIASFNIDVVFSGHTHGGVWRIPFVCGAYARCQGIFPKYSAGKYELKNSTMFLSRGSSRYGVPGRLFNPPEIISVTLKK